MPDRLPNLVAAARPIAAPSRQPTTVPITPPTNGPGTMAGSRHQSML